MATNLTSVAPVPLSKTCQNCATAKVRCNRTENADTCDRCLRIGKDCAFRQASRRFKGWKRDARIEALEAKVNELLGQQESAPSTSASPPHSERGAPPGTARSPYLDPALDHASYGPAGASTAAVPLRPHGAPRPDVISTGLIARETAAGLLDRFQVTMSPHFPFVIVPASVDVEWLRAEKPFLLLAIFAAASYEDVPLQRRLGREVRQQIAQRMIVEGEMTFELLQGLLVYMAWAQFHSRPRRHAQYLHLAISIATELKLDGNVRERSWRTPVRFDAGDDTGASQTRRTQDRDEQRALIGCYYLSSCISKLLQKTSTFPCTPYIEECCRAMYDAPQHPTDRWLRVIVRLQAVFDKIDLMSLRDGSELDVPNSAAQLYVTSMRSKLDALKDGLPFPSDESALLFVQLRTVELYLAQIAMFGFTPTDDRESPVSQWRVDTLCAGLMSAKSLFDFLASLPQRSEMSFNNCQFVQIGFIIVVASQLAVVAADPCVQRETQSYRETLAMSHQLRRVMARVQAMTTLQTDADGDRDCFYHFQRRIRGIQAWYDQRTRDESAADDTVPPTDPTDTPLMDQDTLGDHGANFTGLDFPGPPLGADVLSPSGDYGFPSIELPPGFSFDTTMNWFGDTW